MKSFSMENENAFKVSLALYHNVVNAQQLRQLAMKGNIDATLIKSCMVLDVFQVLAAASKAQRASTTGKLVTKTIHSEVLYCLLPTKNISDCFRKFGLGDSDKSLLVAEIHKDGESKIDDVCGHIEGDAISLSRLPDLADISSIKKVYKIKDPELTVGSLLEAVVGRMASKDFISI